jgi:DNA polymerase I
MGQADLGQFGGNDDRPAAEAAAIAGDTDGTVTVDDHRFPPVEETVEIAVVQVDYTVEGRGSDEYPVVHVFGRTPDNDLVHARVLEFKPYFYAPAEEATEARLREYDRITGWEETDAEGQPYESIRGERLVKIFGQTPRDVGTIRDDFEHYEADILFPNRFLIDKDITSGLRLPVRETDADADRQTLRVHHEEVEPVDVDAEPRVNTFDIEVDDRSGFPEDGEEQIICITSHDSYTDEYVLWLADPGTDAAIPDSLADYEPIETDGAADGTALDTEIRAFDTEDAMLAAFVDYLGETDCDVATGWNFTDFDAPYLLDRLDVLRDRDDPAVERARLDPDRLSRVNEVWRDDWRGPSVKGRVMFDLLYAYRRTKFTELESYRLEDVGQRELGVGKERYPGDIGDLWETDPERLLEYNLRDVELCVELDREQDIIAFWNEVRQFVGCKLEDATTPGDAVDMYVLHKLHDQFSLPSKGQQASEEYEGGAVFDPITGVRENVSVLDLRSLYPMCMVTVNASPETKVDPESYDGETYRAPNGTRFRKEPDGAIREMVDELLAEREEKKGLRDEHDPDEQAYEQYDRQQAAVKVIMNCFTPDTEVLTPEGVQNIRELTVGDMVYSLDPETMEMEPKPVAETQAYPDYRGELVDIETSTIDFRVTPNHRMLVRETDDAGGFDFVEAGRLAADTRYELPHGWTFDHEDALGEQVDPSALTREVRGGQVSLTDGGTAVSWAQTPGKDAVATDELLALLAQSIDGGGASGSEEQTVRDCAGARGGIPEFVFRASSDQKAAFLDALVSDDSDGWQYTTDSERLRDDILRLCAHLGTPATYSADGDCWHVRNARETVSFQLDRDGGTHTAEDGVYCVTVADNHTLLAGRNGTFQFVGQSLYGVLGWDRFRLYDREMGAAVTATGREVIEFTEQATNELDKEVIYGDTDSVMISMGEGVSKAEATEQSFEIEERINDSYDEFAREQLNAAEHRFEIEFEKLYRRFFQAGKKKRYAGHIVWKEGKDVDDIDITGFEYQRSDIAPITKEVQREVIEMIVTGEDIAEVKAYVREIVEGFQDGDVDPEEVGIPGGIGKRLDNYDTDTAQVRGAKYANMLLGTNFGRGSKPKRLYIDRVHSDFFERVERELDLDPAEDVLYGEFKRDPDVICFEYADQVPEEFEIDWETMLDKTLKGPIARILDALDVSWEEVRSGQDQTGLGEYM